MFGVPTLALEDLELPASGIAGPAYATAVEALAVGLSRHGAVVLRLPDPAQAAVLKAGLAALLAGSTRSLPGCELREWRVGGPPDGIAIEEAYGTLEYAARLVLSALCRSSLLRLRGDAFSEMLDDLPHSRSVQSSSVLTARAYTDNFSSLPAEQGAAVLPLFADPQDAVSERGLLSIFHCNEALDPSTGRALSAMQAQGSRGQWQDVQLGPGEIALVLGHTLEHATAGLLRAARHRVVGAPFKASRRSGGRTALHFELRPRPAALLDLRPQLEAAGHAVGAHYSPMSVSSLLEQFESLMSPAAKGVLTPEQQQGAAAHAAWEEASLKRTKKRGSTAGAAAAQPTADLPVTRSGRVRRSAEGLVIARQQQPGAAPAAAAAAAPSADGQKENAGGQGGMDWDGGGAAGRRRSGGASLRAGTAASSGSAGGGFSLGGSGGGAVSAGRRTSLEPASSAALVVVRGRTCAVLEGCLADDPAECLTICVRSFTGMERWFLCNRAISCGAIFEMYCARQGISLGAVKFLLRGERVFGASTPQELQMGDGDELTAVPESSDRLQQQRELGPLFSAVFGPAAAAGAEVKPEPL
ncbi:hypothetical protein ABPG75_006906 [Micractinium tetrahymenae]